MNQKELQEKAQAQRNLLNTDKDGGIAFEDVTKCEVCGSRAIRYIQRPNGVLAKCLDCSDYENKVEDWGEAFCKKVLTGK